MTHYLTQGEIVYSVPITYGNDSRQIGTISLDREVELLLEEGYIFILSASTILETTNRSRKIVEVNISHIESKEKKDD